ncbi:ribonuclease HI protein [Rhizobium phage RHph_Y1_11]|nr:ribonuclease HI protein [Rhizobium phage RHph_Y1_11]
MITIYTDGAVTKEGSGGWAYVVTEDGKQIAAASGQMDNSTNNTMELMGPISALSAIEHADEPFTIISDSQYVVHGITEWIYGWKANGWISSNGTPVKNKELWKELYELVRRFNDMGAPITFEWVKGHAGNQFNEIADKLAQAQSRGAEVEFKWTHTHKKTGGRYRMLRDQGIYIEAGMVPAALYEGEDGVWWVRPKNEFYDGRFEKKPKKVKA